MQVIRHETVYIQFCAQAKSLCEQCCDYGFVEFGFDKRRMVIIGTDSEKADIAYNGILFSRQPLIPGGHVGMPG